MNFVFICMYLIASIFSNDSPKLTIQITDIKKMKGELVIGIFDSEQNFLKEGAAIKNYSVQADETTKFLVIDDLPKGTYAVSLFHDENSDEECNRNFMGIPKEDYGFSNNFKPKFSAPNFEDCKFSFRKDTTLKIKLIN